MTEGSRDSLKEVTNDEAVQAKIVEALNSHDFHFALSTESIGGNAGRNRAAINTLVKSESGEIVYIGNETFIPQGESPESLSRAIFVCDLSEVVKQIQNEEQSQANGKVHIELIIPDEETITDQARLNLQQALEKVNSQ